MGGYLSCVYLSMKASGVQGEYGSKELREGLNTILESLHNGTSLDEIIKKYTDYDGVIGFENDWLSENDFLDCAVNYLNCLKEISAYSGSLANGSILLELDTKAKSAIEGRTETSDGQKVMIIKDEQQSVVSTVDETTAKSTAGSYHVWEPTDTDTNLYNTTIPAAAKPAATSSPEPASGSADSTVSEAGNEAGTGEETKVTADISDASDGTADPSDMTDAAEAADGTAAITADTEGTADSADMTGASGETSDSADMTDTAGETADTENTPHDTEDTDDGADEDNDTSEPECSEDEETDDDPDTEDGDS